jgi:hypothetical protein
MKSKKSTIPQLFLIVSIALVSFAFKPPQDALHLGTFTVSADDASQITLMIKEDGTFYYQDFSNTKNKIQVTGTWQLQKRTVTLVHKSATRFHDKWKISKDGMAATSRKGALYYRLIKHSALAP